MLQLIRAGRCTQDRLQAVVPGRPRSTLGRVPRHKPAARLPSRLDELWLSATVHASARSAHTHNLVQQTSTRLIAAEHATERRSAPVSSSIRRHRCSFSCAAILFRPAHLGKALAGSGSRTTMRPCEGALSFGHSLDQFEREGRMHCAHELSHSPRWATRAWPMRPLARPVAGGADGTKAGRYRGRSSACRFSRLLLRRRPAWGAMRP